MKSNSIRTKWEKLAALSTEQLVDDKLAAQIEAFVTGIVENWEPGEARYSVVKLQDILSRHPAIQDSHPDVFERYDLMVARMIIHSLSGTPSRELEHIFSTRVLSLLKCYPGLETLEAGLAGLFLLTFDDLLDNVERNHIVKSLEKNEEVLGAVPLEIKGQARPSQPQIKNWLRSFNLYALATGVNRGSIQVPEYVVKTPAAVKLTTQDKAVLIRLLQLYSWLKFPRPKPIETKLPSIPAPALKPQPRIIPPAPPPPRPKQNIESRITNHESRVNREERPQNVPPLKPVTPRQSSVNEALYRSTLEELAKQRAEYEKKIEARISNLESSNKIAPPTLPPPRRGEEPSFSLPLVGRDREGGATVRPVRKIAVGGENKEQFNQEFKGKPLGSLNESLISAGNANPPQGRGEIVPGKEIDEKLKDLDKKVNGKSQSDLT